MFLSANRKYSNPENLELFGNFKLRLQKLDIFTNMFHEAAGTVS